MILKIYAGLSLTEREVRQALPRALFSTPIKRGDLSKDIVGKVNVVGIIDGEFNKSLAVTPTEVLDALRCGLRIYGSSSMGAMRAVELSAHGMIGYGEIFEHIAARPYFPDDHLGQIFFADGKFKGGFPIIDLILELKKMVKAQIVDARTARAMERAYSKLHFSERTLGALRVLFSENDKVLRIVDRLDQGSFSTKRRDGAGLLKLIRRDLREIRSLNRRLSPST